MHVPLITYHLSLIIYLHIRHAMTPLATAPPGAMVGWLWALPSATAADPFAAEGLACSSCAFDDRKEEKKTKAHPLEASPRARRNEGEGERRGAQQAGSRIFSGGLLAPS